MRDLAAQLEQALATFSGRMHAPALIGGLALAAHGVLRPTADIDLLVDGDDAEAAHAALLRLGYDCVFRSSEAASYRRDAQSLHLMYAHRPLARRLLAEAEVRDTPVGRQRVISREGLIACKLQGWVNNPARQMDLEDIRCLLRLHSDVLDMDEVRGYFELFDQEALLDAMLAERSD